MAGTSILQNSLSGTAAVAEPVGLPLLTAAGRVAQSIREAVITSAMPPRYDGLPFTRNADDSGAFE
jgi:hypothetical protein